MSSGIYGIRHIASGKIYIGSTKSLSARKRRHFNTLINGCHHNKHLQSAFNKYGQDAFEWIVLEGIANPELLHIREKVWIIDLDSANHNKGYNFNSEPNAMQGRHHTAETKQRMSQAKQGLYEGSNNPNFGRKQSVSTRLKMSECNGNVKLTKSDVLSIVEFLKQGYSHQEIANKFNISRTVVTRISNGTRWANVTGGAIVPLVHVNGIRQFTDTHRKRMLVARRARM